MEHADERDDFSIAEDCIYLNGVDGVTGKYLPIEAGDAESGAEQRGCVQFEELLEVFKGSVLPPEKVAWLKGKAQSLSEPHLGMSLIKDEEDIHQTGWAVVFPRAYGEGHPVRAALEPLLDLRARQVGDDRRFKVLTYGLDGGYSEDWTGWLARHDVSAGTVEPRKVPFYLLLVGGPEEIPFSLAHELGIEYAVGRLHFDRAEDYRAYAESVVSYEVGEAAPASNEAVFFGPRHDASTRLSADYLLDPLVEGLPDADRPRAVEVGHLLSRKRMGGAGIRFNTRKLKGAEATKGALLEVFSPAGGAPRPAFLFTASHGMGFPKGHPNQPTQQGALLCQDWPGVGSMHPSHYLAAADVPDEARVHGLIAFHFACYSAATPSRSRYAHKPGATPPQLAEQSFTSALPKRLLTHPGGGALACIGHIDRAFGYSIVSRTNSSQLIPFENAVASILAGRPVGLALKDFSQRYSALSAAFANVIEKVKLGFATSPERLARLWVERNDAEGYSVLGDPAVRLRFGQGRPGGA